jgi:hypothetical protein
MYRRFGADFPDLDRSEEAKLAMYRHESLGDPEPVDNGYVVGKSWMDATVKMWREDIGKGNLLREELDFPGWFLDRVLA